MNEQKSWYPTPVQRSMLDFMKECQPQLYAELRTRVHSLTKLDKNVKIAA